MASEIPSRFESLGSPMGRFSNRIFARDAIARNATARNAIAGEAFSVEAVERRCCGLRCLRGHATRVDEHATAHRAVDILNAVIAQARRSSDKPRV